MAFFDGLLRLAQKLGAESLVIESDQVPLINLHGHTRPLSMPPVPHHLLTSFVEELDHGDTSRKVTSFDIAVDRQAASIRLSFCHIPTEGRGASRANALQVEHFPKAMSEGVRISQASGSWAKIRVTIAGVGLELVRGDITAQDTEAIVNAAHPDLLGGQGVDGAIHFRGGPKILEACRCIGGCPIGDAVITTGGLLPARYVIHTVGPVYDPYRDERPLLASAYRRCLEVASEYRLRSLSFPSISTGAFCFPFEKAAPVALATIIDFLEREIHWLALVRIVVYGRESPSAFSVFEGALRALLDVRSHAL